jgi:cytoskeletal protein CcmA (bactofilin family)
MDEPRAPATTIGSTVVIKGKIKSDEDLIVQGRIEADISSTKALLVESTGIVKASVRAKSIRIRGIVVGNLTATKKIEIAPEGRVVGDMNAPNIVISDGAAFRGKIDMPNFDEPREVKPLLAAVPAADAVMLDPDALQVEEEEVAPPPVAKPAPPRFVARTEERKDVTDKVQRKRW